MDNNLAKKLFEEVSSSKLISLKNDFISYAVEYARIRVDWFLSDEEGKDQIEELRTRKHNALIDSCNILSREMNKAGENTAWRIELGTDRKSIGDFACYLHCILGINAR